MPGTRYRELCWRVFIGDDVPVVEVGRLPCQIFIGVELPDCFGEAIVEAKCKASKHEGVALFAPSPWVISWWRPPLLFQQNTEGLV